MVHSLRRTSGHTSLYKSDILHVFDFLDFFYATSEYGNLGSSDGRTIMVLVPVLNYISVLVSVLASFLLGQDFQLHFGQHFKLNFGQIFSQIVAKNFKSGGSLKIVLTTNSHLRMFQIGALTQREPIQTSPHQIKVKFSTFFL